MREKVAVIGAGIGGLSAAALLARSGRRVTIFEQAPYSGGKAASLKLGEFRFDTGPSLFTLPHIFREFFARLGLEMCNYIEPIPLEPICAYEFSDGTRLCSYSDRARFAAELESTGAATAGELDKYLDGCARIWDKAGELFLTRSLHEPSTYMSLGGMKAILNSPRLSPFRSLHDANKRAFQDRRAVQLFDRYATYNGSNPFLTPSTMRVIPHVEYAYGGYALKGGIVSLPLALERICRNLGVDFRLGERVERIAVKQKRVCGIEAGEDFHASNIVVSNADVLSTYRSLLRETEAREARRYERLEPSSSGLVFLWGVAAQFPRLLSNNIFFSGDYRDEFDAMFRRLDMPNEPTIYVNITSKITPEDAPPDGENWFVLLNSPRSAEQDWRELISRSRRYVLTRLSRSLGCEIAPLIREEKIITPPDIERDTGSTYGSLYGIASHSPLSAFLRHPNRSRRIRGLYFAGGSAHPGGGMPLALLSGMLAAYLAERHE